MTILLRTRRLSDALYRVFDGRSAPSATRPFLTAGSHDAVHEHHRAIGLLVSDGLCGSALCLLRPMFDGCLRGPWLRHIATDQEVEQFSKGQLEFQPTEALKGVEKRNLTGADGLRRVYDAGWKAMSSYVHGGFHQVVCRLGVGFIGSNYPQDEIDALLEEANWIALLSAVETAEVSTEATLLDAVIEVGGRYADNRI